MEHVKYILGKGLALALLGTILFGISCSDESGMDPEPEPEPSGKASGIYESDQNKSLNLNVVYFYPKGTTPLPLYTDRLSEILSFYQDFIASEFEFHGFVAKSFGLLRDTGDPDIVKIIPIEGARTAYTKSSGNTGYVRQEVEAWFAAHPKESAGPVTLVFQPSATGESGSNFNTGEALAFTGVNQMGFLIDYKEFNMRHFRTGTSEGNAFKIGSELHEFFHMLGIPHDRELLSETDDWECIMSGGGGKMSRPESAGKVHITKTAVAILDAHPLFNDSPSPFFTNPGVSINSLIVRFENDKIVLSGNVSSGSKIHYLGVYHDAAPYGLNKDYDAIDWLAPVADDGSVNLEMPLSEFYPASAIDPMLVENKEIQMVLRFIHQDGSISTSEYLYKIVNGRPDVNLQVKTDGPTTTVPGSSAINELDKSGWTVSYISSEEAGKPGGNLIDNDIQTFWHSRWSSEPVGNIPQTFIIDMGEEKTVNGFTFVQRQQPDASNPGPLQVHVRDIVIEASSDANTWTKLGEFQLRKITDLQAQILPSAANLRYFKVSINSTFDKSVCALAEIGVY